MLENGSKVIGIVVILKEHLTELAPLKTLYQLIYPGLVTGLSEESFLGDVCAHVCHELEEQDLICVSDGRPKGEGCTSSIHSFLFSGPLDVIAGIVVVVVVVISIERA